jgi:NAD(P)-dependent dehydrogenase (short-subunit alcohol dehydrogenase family)
MDYMQGVGEMADDIWRRVLSINLDGPMFATRKAIPHMVLQGSGTIVNTASTAGIRGRSGRRGLHRVQTRAGRADAQYRVDVREEGHSL